MMMFVKNTKNTKNFQKLQDLQKASRTFVELQRIDDEEQDELRRTLVLEKFESSS
jgi:hypothetical protein